MYQSMRQPAAGDFKFKFEFRVSGFEFPNLHSWPNTVLSVEKV
jgi:hypothetical protein